MDYDYTVYEESVSQWVRNLFAGAYDDPEEPVYTDVEAFVARLYENVLGRTPDEKGLAAWVSQLTSGANGGEEVAKGFIFSDEYTKKNTSNDAFVEMLYNTLLNRKSDAAGKKAWVAQKRSWKDSFIPTSSSESAVSMVSSPQLRKHLRPACTPSAWAEATIRRV